MAFAGVFLGGILIQRKWCPEKRWRWADTLVEGSIPRIVIPEPTKTHANALHKKPLSGRAYHQLLCGACEPPGRKSRKFRSILDCVVTIAGLGRISQWREEEGRGGRKGKAGESMSEQQFAQDVLDQLPDVGDYGPGVMLPFLKRTPFPRHPLAR